MRPAVALALMALLTGCGERERQADPAPTEPPPCSPGRSQPISEATLKSVLAKHGIHLYRDDRCEEFKDPDGNPLPDAPRATFGNSRSSLDYDRVASTEGFILCELHRGGPVGIKQRRATRVQRIKYEGDEETHLSVLNVDCAIYPDSPEQIERLEAGLSDLRLATG